MTLAEGPLPLRAALVALGLLALLAPVHCSQGRPSWRYSSSEVVIPKKEVGRGKGLWLPGRLSYSLRFGGQRHVIHLWRKTLLWPRHLPVMTQDDQGALQTDDPYIPADCFYLGHLEEVPLSMVTIDTCRGGLEGIMKLDDLAYEIAPLKDSLTFEHTVSQIVADINATGPTYKLGLEEDVNTLFPPKNFSDAPRVSSFYYSSHKGFLKGHIQAANAMYHTFNNVTNCVTYMIRMFSVVDACLQSLDIRYYIFLMTVYTTNDPVRLNDYRVPGSPIHNTYVQLFYRRHQPASSTLLMLDGPHESLFEPATYSLCNENALLISSHLDRHYLLLAIINANMQGRLLGLYYDIRKCVCQRRSICIMSRFPRITDSFSNCSFLHVQHVLFTGRFNHCLFGNLLEYKNITLLSRCGDYQVDETEACDCGSLKQCYSNPCCESDCTFSEESICDKQTCCSNCTYTATGTLCRTIQNMCDLPEYCTGSTEHCPEDLYLQNGTPCTEEGYCYNGNCTDRNMHCKEIFGAMAHNADESCYGINMQTFRFGHCRRPETRPTYIACSGSNKMCGRLQCTNVTRVPQLQNHVSFHQSLIEGQVCFGLDEHRATGSTDAGHVRHGAPCAPGRFCINSTCTGEIANLEYDCLPGKCNFKGMCNNLRECHCHVGWDPPLCLKKGAGGSESSGPPPRESRKIRQKTDVVTYLRWVVGRIYALMAALLFGMATNVKNVKKTIVQQEETIDLNDLNEIKADPEPL